MHVGARHMGPVDIGIAEELGGGFGGAAAIERNPLQMRMHEHAALIECLERQK